MATLKPFAALRPKPELAAQICELPYDVMSSDEARVMAAGNPLSFLHVSKPEIDLPPGTDLYAPEVYAKGKENLQNLIGQGTLNQDAQPRFYFYRQVMGQHSQVGLVAAASCEEYLNGVIKKHELTRPDKEDDRVRHIEMLNSQTGPVFLTYRAVAAMDDFVARRIAGPPDMDFTAKDGVRHTAWTLGDPAGIQFVADQFARIPSLYIADGHHRSAAAARVYLKRKSARPHPASGHPLPSDGRGAGGEGLTSEQRVLRALASRQPAPSRVQLGALTEADVRTIVVAYLAEYCHELDREHLDTLCAITQARNPLYLLVMLNELRTLGGNDLNRIVPARIAAMPQDHPDTVSLFRWVLQRLEVFGPEAVRWWCLYLAHGRVGMASHELAGLLARKFGADAAAIALRIERGLRRYLQRRGLQLDFFHGQLRQAVFEQYGSQAETVNVHHEIAQYFIACARGTDSQKEWETNSVRGFAECVFHRIKAGRNDEAAGLLRNFPFLLHKLRVGLLEGVFDDYDIFRRESLPEVATPLEIWSDFFREKAHILRRGNDEWPSHKILLQLAVEHSDDSPLTIGAERWLGEGRCDWLWLRRNRRLAHIQKSPCVATLEGHTGYVHGTLLLRDGLVLSWSSDHTLRLWDTKACTCLGVLEGHADSVHGANAMKDGRILSWSADRTLQLWDVESCCCRAVLRGHTSWCKGAKELCSGEIMSWSSDKTLRLWDARSGDCRIVLTGHMDSCNGAMELSNSRILSWSSDLTLRLWDSEKGNCLATLQGHCDVLSADVLVDGRILSWSSDGTLRLWNEHSGRSLAVLEGHTDWVKGALELSSGHILSWSDDKTLRLWDRQTAACQAIFTGHTNWINGAVQLTDGKILSWADDKTIRLWNMQTAVCLAVFEGHSWDVTDAKVLTDGRVLSVSLDKTMRLWDVQSDLKTASLERHGDWVAGAKLLPDDKLVSWSDDHTLRIWDGNTGICMRILNGHEDHVRGVQLLSDGRLLSWSNDQRLCLWDAQSGECLRTFDGHTAGVGGAKALRNGRILSWSHDNTLRFWNVENGECKVILEGHNRSVQGALELADGRILSWSSDTNLRIWDGNTGLCLKVLVGHTGFVRGAKTLRDGRILSWSKDKTLRVWNAENGECIVILRGHKGLVSWAEELADGKILSRSAGDDLSLLWDERSGVCLEVIPDDQLEWETNPEICAVRHYAWGGDCVFGHFAARPSGFLTELMLTEPRTLPPFSFAIWQARVRCVPHALSISGAVALTQVDGEIPILHLYHGKRRVTLTDAEMLLASRREKAE